MSFSCLFLSLFFQFLFHVFWGFLLSANIFIIVWFFYYDEMSLFFFSNFFCFVLKSILFDWQSIFILVASPWFITFTKFGKFLAIISWNDLSFPFLSLLLGLPLTCLSLHVMVSHRYLSLCSFFFTLFLSVLLKTR